MNWFDYTRGYDDGQQDSYMATHNNGLLSALLRLIFFFVVFPLRLSYTVLKGLAALLWLILKTILGRK